MKANAMLPIAPRIATIVAAAIAIGGVFAQVSLAGADPGAQSGNATAFNKSIVKQHNVQIIAGDQATKDNSSQFAYNEANINQYSEAVSGDASSQGGSATSGNATAGNIAIVHQLNVQVIAGRGCSAEQEAYNIANVNQGALAVSGDATSVYGNAHSGNATALNVGVVHQRNIQVAACNGHGSGPSSQYAANVADLNQGAIAVSGDATSLYGNARSGDATSINYGEVRQRNHQFAR